jgi:glycerol-3-phosphate acyltransferase PlsX
MRIALDAMGGDFAPKNNVEGAVLALKEYPELEKLFLVGDAVAIGNELKRIGFQDERIEILHASQVVKNGSAHAVVSAGHTGAAVAASVLKLRTLTGIERPAVACLLPTEKGVFVLCDAGANIDSSPQNLLQFGIMGAVFAEHVLGLKRPTVGLLSIGEEDVKGNDTTKEAFKLLKSANLNFRGNVEGHDLYEDGAEVVVCDGFVGNIVLKTSESIAYAIFGWLRRELTKKFIRKLGAQLARGAFRTIIREIRAYNDKFATASTAVR